MKSKFESMIIFYLSMINDFYTLSRFTDFKHKACLKENIKGELESLIYALDHNLYEGEKISST